MADGFCLKNPDFHVTFRDILHAVNLRHGTDDFTSPPKEGVPRIFFSLKNPTASVGFEHANLGTKGHYRLRGLQEIEVSGICRQSIHEGGKFVSLHTGRLYTHVIFLVLISVRR